MSHPDPEGGESSSSTLRHHNQPCRVESSEVVSTCLPESKLLLLAIFIL